MVISRFCSESIWNINKRDDWIQSFCLKFSSDIYSRLLSRVFTRFQTKSDWNKLMRYRCLFQRHMATKSRRESLSLLDTFWNNFHQRVNFGIENGEKISISNGLNSFELFCLELKTPMGPILWLRFFSFHFKYLTLSKSPQVPIVFDSRKYSIRLRKKKF